MAQDPNMVPFTVLPGDSILSYRNSTFSILGQVEKPRHLRNPGGLPLEHRRGDPDGRRIHPDRRPEFRRCQADGQRKGHVLKVRAGDMAKEPDVVPFEVLPGDIIKVNESWF